VVVIAVFAPAMANLTADPPPAGGVTMVTLNEWPGDVPHNDEEIPRDPGLNRIGIELSVPSGIDFPTSFDSGLRYV
jgi:hypothetical protein